MLSGGSLVLGMGTLCQPVGLWNGSENRLGRGCGCGVAVAGGRSPWGDAVGWWTIYSSVGATGADVVVVIKVGSHDPLQLAARHRPLSDDLGS